MRNLILFIIGLFVILQAEILKNHNYGSNGQITFSPYPVSIEVGNNGTIYVGISDNTTNADFTFYSYYNNGTLDTNFGSSGSVTADFNGTDVLKLVGYESSNGTLHAMGFSNGTYYAEAMYDTSGTLLGQIFHDLSNITYVTNWIDVATDYSNGYLLGANGTHHMGIKLGANATAIFNTSSEVYNAMGVLSDGSYILGGKNSSFGYVRKFFSNGTLDSSFSNSTGYYQFSPPSEIFDIKIDYSDSDAIYASGSMNSDLFAVKMFSNGTINTSFGSSGYLTFDISGSNSTDGGGWISKDGSGTYYLAGIPGSNTYLTQFSDVTIGNIPLNNGWTYFSLGADFLACNASLSASNSSCQDTYDLEKLFGTPKNSFIKYIVTYNSNNGTWSYYNKNSSNTTYSMNVSNTTIGQLKSVDIPMGLMIKTTATGSVSIPAFTSYSDQSSRWFNNLNSGWNLMGSAENTLSMSDFQSASDANGVSLKYILLLRNSEWLVYAPTNDSEVDSSLTRLQYIYPNESYWVYIE